MVVLVVDDHFARVASSEDPFYDRGAFLEDYHFPDISYCFCSGWNPVAGRFSTHVVTEYIRSMPRAPDTILLDVRFAGDDALGLEILDSVTRQYPLIPVIMMTAVPRHDLLDRCIAVGAVDYLVKPIQREILRSTLDRYVGTELSYWLLGQTETFQTAVDAVARAAEGGRSSVLLLGEPGTGKELFARYLHRHGPRRSGPFQIVHIPAIPEHLVEAELFGYSRGAFTGAAREELGRLRRADGGVLFLDEVADLGPVAQAALLRVLEAREVTRLGDGQQYRIDIQVVAATNANLPELVKTNAFRRDLYSRLGGTIINLPSVAHREKDLPLIIRHLMRRGSVERGLTGTFPPLSRAVYDVIHQHSWSGNVRDIWNFIQRVFDDARGKIPDPDDFRNALLRLHAAAGASAPEGSETEYSFTHVGLTLDKVSREELSFPDRYLRELARRELSLVYAALELTRDPLTGKPSRAKAAALLKGKERCSTNEFDRWVRRLLDQLGPESTQLILSRYPLLIAAEPQLGRESQ